MDELLGQRQEEEKPDDAIYSNRKRPELSFKQNRTYVDMFIPMLFTDTCQLCTYIRHLSPFPESIVSNGWSKRIEEPKGRIKQNTESDDDPSDAKLCDRRQCA